MAERLKATVSKIVVGATSPRVQIPLSPPFFLQKMANEDVSLLFTVRSTTSLKRRSLFFTSSPNSREDLLVKTFHSANAPFHLWRGRLALPACHGVIKWSRMKFSPFLLRQGCGGQAGSKDGVLSFTALRLHGGKVPWFFHLRWYITSERRSSYWRIDTILHMSMIDKLLHIKYSLVFSAWQIGLWMICYLRCLCKNIR